MPLDEFIGILYETLYNDRSHEYNIIVDSRDSFLNVIFIFFTYYIKSKKHYICLKARLNIKKFCNDAKTAKLNVHKKIYIPFYIIKYIHIYIYNSMFIDVEGK